LTVYLYANSEQYKQIGNKQFATQSQESIILKSILQKL